MATYRHGAKQTDHRASVREQFNAVRQNELIRRQPRWRPGYSRPDCCCWQFVRLSPLLRNPILQSHFRNQRMLLRATASESLRRIYEALGGPDWIQRDFWGSDKPSVNGMA